MPVTSGSASRPVRVAHVIQNLNYGGMERVLHNLGRRLPEHGYEVHIVVLQYLGRFAEDLECVTFHQVPRMSRFSLLHPGKLIDVLTGIAPDIVHSHTGVWLKAATAARAAGARAVVHTEHGRPDPVPLSDRFIDNRASRRTDVVIAVSNALASVLRSQVVHNPAQLRVIANGVDTACFSSAADHASLRQELGIPQGASVIGSIGRLEPIKNYRLALHAFARLVAAQPLENWPWLVLAGDGSERTALEQLSAELGITQRVLFLGWRPDAERIYAAFDLFTLTSRSEGTSVSLLEAMSTGVCPLVTDVGGNRAVLGPELDTLLVPDNDEVSLAAGWKRLLHSAPLRAQLAARARARVVREFSVERMVDQHAALYRELLGTASPLQLARAAHTRV